MRVFALTCLVSLVVVTFLAEPVEAGRRRRRRAGATAAVAVATARRPVVVAAPRRPVVVAAAPRATVIAAAAVRTPDLTITELTTENDLQYVTVKNIGSATSPATHCQLDFRRITDGTLLATQKVRVSPLQVNQSVRFRLHALPHGDIRVIAHVDPDQRISESNEQNNDLSVKIAMEPPNVEPTALEDVDVWVHGEAAHGNRNE